MAIRLRIASADCRSLWRRLVGRTAVGLVQLRVIYAAIQSLHVLRARGVSCVLGYRPSGRPPEGGRSIPRAPDLVELTTLDPTITLDIRYATSNKLAGRPV